jgi:hypothetical protein
LKRFLAFFGAHYGVLLAVCLLAVIIVGCQDTAKMYRDLSEKYWSYVILRDQALTVEKIILKRLVETPPDTSVIGSRHYCVASQPRLHQNHIIDTPQNLIFGALV